MKAKWTGSSGTEGLNEVVCRGTERLIIREQRRDTDWLELVKVGRWAYYRGQEWLK